MIDYAGGDGFTPTIGRGGWYRNFHGEALVKLPNGRTAIYDGASSLLEFKPYRGDPIWGELGQHVHDLAYFALARDGIPVEVVARGVELGMSEALQRHIYVDFQRHAAVQAIVDPIIERTVVVDEWKVATNIDILVPDRGEVRDIKSAGDCIKPGYLVQLAAGSRSLPYDVESGKRGEWATPLNRDVAFIDWFPIAAAIKADPADLPKWQAWKVDLPIGHAIGEQLFAIKTDATHKGAFTLIADGDDARHAASPSVERTLTAEHAAELEADGVDVDAYAKLPPPARTKYRDLAATPTQVDDVAYLNDHPDEGDVVDPATVADIGKRYNALPDARRRWVTTVAANIRLNPSTGGVASERRRLLLTSLVDLSADFADDDIVRGISHRYLGDIAHATNVNVADLVGALGIDEAQRFANAVKALINGNASLRYNPTTGACYVEPSKAA